MNTNTHPQSIAPPAVQAEKALIGALILSGGRALEEITLNPAHYQAPVHEHLHRAIQALAERGEPVDAVTVQTEAHQHVQGQWDPAYVHQCMTEAPAASSAAYYAGLVATAAAHRQARTIGAGLTEMADQQANPDLIAAQGIEALGKLTTTSDRQPVEFMGETLQATVDALDETPRYRPTPWPQLNNRIGGLRPGALYTIGARPAVGKSIIALELALELASHGSVAFVSMEMSADELHRRALANVGRIDGSRLENNQVTDEDRHRIAEARKFLDHAPIAVLDRKATIEQIRHFAARTHRRRPLSGLIVDYLQLIETPPGDKRHRHEFIAHISRQLKLMARELDIPVIALSQLNRDSTKEDQMPRMSQMRESGAIEQDSDVVVLLHKDPETPWELQLLVAKNRRGTAGPLTLDFLGYYYSVSDPRSKHD